MQERENAGSDWVDPDDAPELTAEWFQKAELREGNRMIRPGQPPLDIPEYRSTSVDLDADVAERLRKSGPDWQVRMNDALRRWLDAEDAAG